MVIKGILPRLRTATACAALATACLVNAPADAQTNQGPMIAFDIPAGSLQSALTIFASQSGLQIIYAPEAVARQNVARLHEHLSARAALEHLIATSGLHIRQVSTKVIMLERERSADSGEPTASPPSSFPVAVTGAQANDSLPTTADDGLDHDVVVTGSHIRGEAPVGSHVRTINRAEIDRNGYSSVAQVLQALPGNFGGVATEQSSLALVDHSATNATLATGVDLRGLGADATLVLVNGHRLAGAGNLGDFADVSDIPISLVDRVEVLMDGASAIYGSDAVGGVINIIMKDRFDGLESSVRYGSVTAGGMREFQAYQIAGTSWATGNVVASYEFDDRTALLTSDRRFSRTADSRSLGGTDHRTIAGLPGNVLGFDPVTGALEPAYAIPPGQDGTSLQPGDFLAGQTNYGDPLQGAYLTPHQTRNSVYAAAHQDLGGGVRLSLDGRFTRRNFESLAGGYVTILTVTDNNPWFVSPTGQSSDLIAYNFGRELGPSRDTGWSESLGFTGALDVQLSPRWKLSAYGGYAQSRERYLGDQLANEAILAEALGTVPDDPTTAYSPARDGYFNPYGDGSSNSPAVLAAVGSGFDDQHNQDQVTTGDLQADGPLVDLPAGPVSIALGANVRREVFGGDYTAFNYTTTPTIYAPTHYGRTILAAFGEARIPLFGEQNARAGLQHLELSLAGRIERYPDFGTTANPKFGANWSPIAGVMLRATYGTSFRAPNLQQLHDIASVSTTTLPNASGASVLALYLGGGNPDLKPERARSWTIGIDLQPTALPGLQFSGTLFRTIFDQRIDRPVAQDLAGALSDPDLAPFVRFVSPASNTADHDYVSALIGSIAGGGATFPVNNISAVVDGRYVNTSSVDVRGIDMTVGYTLKSGSNVFSLNGNGTYLLAWRQRTTPTSAAIDERNLSSHPVAFRGRLTAGWQRGGIDALIGVNYVNSYRAAVTDARIDAWTTFDARIAWTAPKGTWMAGTTLALVAQNLFDQDPPFYDAASGVGYDAANSDATGRFVSFQITRHW